MREQKLVIMYSCNSNLSNTFLSIVPNQEDIIDLKDKDATKEGKTKTASSKKEGQC